MSARFTHLVRQEERRRGRWVEASGSRTICGLQLEFFTGLTLVNDGATCARCQRFAVKGSTDRERLEKVSR